jgi:hypothetical protein
MLNGRVEPFTVPTMLRVVPTVAHATIQIAKIPQMLIPQETIKGVEA